MRTYGEHIETREELLKYLSELLEIDWEIMIARSEFVADPGFVLVKLHNGMEFIVRAEAEVKK